MGRSNRSKRSCNIGKGQATPKQIAYIVDRYLYENGFKETRNLFRTEAASLISNTPLRQSRNCAMIPLEELLNEYLLLKEHKVAVEYERVRLNQEKIRVEKLLHGMQNVMNTYNASYFAPTYPPVAPKQQQNNYRASPSGNTQYTALIGMPMSLLGNKKVDSKNCSTPLNSESISGKRKAPEVSVGAPPVSTKPMITTTQEKSIANEMNKITQAGYQAANNLSFQAPSGILTMAQNSAPNGLMMTGQGSGVVKCLLNKADSSISTSSQCFVTPQKLAFSPPGIDNSNSIQKEVTPTKERFTMSDTDAEKWLEAQAISEDALLQAIDFSNLDSIDENVLFPLDLNLDYEGSSPESMDGNFDLNKFMSEYASIVCEVTQEKDMSTQGDDAQDRNKMHNESWRPDLKVASRE